MMYKKEKIDTPADEKCVQEVERQYFWPAIAKAHA